MDIKYNSKKAEEQNTLAALQQRLKTLEEEKRHLQA